MIFHVVGQDLVGQRRDRRWNLSKRPAWRWNYPLPARSAQGQGSAIPIPSGNTIVAVPDGQLGRRLIGVEYVRQGWGRNRTDTARGSRTVSDQPTRGPLTRAHAAGAIGTWRPGRMTSVCLQNRRLRFESVFDSLCCRGWWALIGTSADVPSGTRTGALITDHPC